MKPITINVQITKCPKQYEAVRLGMECSLDAGETVEGAIKAATAQLDAIYEEIYVFDNKTHQNTQKPATNANSVEDESHKNTNDANSNAKERLIFSDPRVQQIIKRIERMPEKTDEILANTHKYFEPDEDVEKVLQAAVRINKNVEKVLQTAAQIYEK